MRREIMKYQFIWDFDNGPDSSAFEECFYNLDLGSWFPVVYFGDPDMALK